MSREFQKSATILDCSVPAGAAGAAKGPQTGRLRAPAFASAALRMPALSVWGVLALIIAVGVYFRIANLGQLGFRWDEDLSSLAVKAILATGIPALPSGMVYLRGGPVLYAMAASAKLLGFGELSMRLPAALAGIALIPLGFVLGRRLFDERVGLVLAALIAISQWDIEFSRYARMYALFALVYLLTLLCIWKYRVRSQSTLGGLLCVALAVLAISMHQLGYTLAAAMFYPLILRGPRQWLRPRNLAFPLAAAAVVAVSFFAWSGLVEHLRELPFASAGVGLPAAAQAGRPPMWLPQLPILQGILSQAPWAFAAIATCVTAAAAVLILRSRDWRGPERAIGAGIAVCCALGVFNFALLGVLALAWIQRVGLPALRSAHVRAAAALVAVAFAAWVVLAAALLPAAGSAAAVKAAVRGLLDYPHFFVFWGFVRQWPLVSIVAAVGGLWAFDRSARAAGDPRCSFLLLALGTPLVLNGLFATSYEIFRYDVPFDPLFFAFVALGLVRWPQVLSAWKGTPAGPSHTAGESIPSSARRGVIAAGLLMLVLGYGLNPVRGLLVTDQDYRNRGFLYRAFALTSYPDFKTPAAYVAAHASPADTVVVLDSREIYNYLGRADYWVRDGVYDTQTYREDGRLHDLYVKTPLLMSAGALERVLSAPNRTKWLIASDSMLAHTKAVDGAIKRYIRGQEAHVVYVGRDGDTKVYRFE